MGAILYNAGSYDLASQALQHAVALQNNYANAMFLLGLSFDKMGRHADALGIIQAVAQLDPNNETVQGVVANLTAGKPAIPTPARKKSSAQ